MLRIRNAGAPAAIAVAVAAGVTACGGGGSHGNAVPAAPGVSSSPVAETTGRAAATASLTISVPASVAISGHGRTPRFVSPGTLSLSVSAALHGNNQIVTSPTVLTTANLSPTSSGCTALNAAPAYAYVCTVPVPIPASLTSVPIDVDVATYDVAAASISASVPNVPLYQQNTGTVLGEGLLTNVTVTQNTSNATFPPVVLSGRIATVSYRGFDATGQIYVPVTNASASPSPFPVPLAITAKDASGATIIGQYLTPITVTIATPVPALSLQVLNVPTAAPTAAPNPTATTIANSGDQLALLASGKGVLANTLTLAVTGGFASVPTPIPIVPNGIGSYQEYDVYGNNGYPLAGGQMVDTLTSGANGTILYAFEDGGTGGGIGQTAFSAAGPTFTQCTFAGSPTFPYRAMAVSGSTVYVVDASTTPHVYGFPIAFGGGACSASLNTTLTLAAQDTGTVQRVAVVNNSNPGRGPELWLSTQTFLYAISLTSGAQETFYFYGAPTPGLDGDGTAMATITGLQAFDSAMTGLSFGTVTQGILYGDSSGNQGLDVAGVQPSPAPSSAPIYRETPGPGSFANGSVAFTYKDSFGTQHFAFADTSGTVATRVPNGSPVDGTSSNWIADSTPFTTPGGFGPQFVVTGAENGAAMYGVGGSGGNYASRGVIRYALSGNTGTAIVGIPNNFAGTPNYTGAALGGDGRIYMADSNGKAIYAFPGYGNTGSGAGYRPTHVQALAKDRRPPATTRTANGQRP
jgi:hypothetical protein